MPKYTIDSKKIKAILFDFDGTLVHSEHINHNAYSKVYEELGLVYHPLEEHIMLYGGLKAEEVFNIETKRLKINWDLSKVVSRKREIYHKVHEETIIEFVSGALELLKRAQELKLKIAIVSMGYFNVITRHLEKASINIKFDTIIGFEAVSKPKPDPECYLKAASNLKEKIENCLVFEDTIPGIQSAINAEMDYIALSTTLGEERIKEHFTKAKIIKDFTQVKIK